MDETTVAVYQRQATEWRDRRTPTERDRAAALATAARSGPAGDRPVADLGCGSGGYTTALGRPAVAIDAARAMVELTAGAAPGAWAVQADLEALPLRRGALGGAWARCSYVHVARARVPLALADLHRALVPGAPVAIRALQGDQELDVMEGDDFAGRRYSAWPPGLLADVLAGAGFTVDELVEEADTPRGPQLWVRATRARTLPDTVGPGMRLLVCGLNPSLYAADAGIGFARPGNRFWPAAVAAGLVARERDPRAALVDHGLGLTDLVKRATAAAAELTPEEYRDGLARVTRLVTWLRPRAVCFVGLAGWRAAVDRRAAPGRQARDLGGVPVYVMPSTSGLNAHSAPAALAGHLRAAAALADGGAA